jgi:hypothetical protein
MEYASWVVCSLVVWLLWWRPFVEPCPWLPMPRWEIGIKPPIALNVSQYVSRRKCIETAILCCASAALIGSKTRPSRRSWRGKTCARGCSTPEIHSKIVFHFTPVHASWLNVAELEIGVLERQCLKRQRFVDEGNLRVHVKAWEKPRNKAQVKINWKFTKEKAKKTFKFGDV